MNNFYCARYYVTYRCNSKCRYCDIPSRQTVRELDIISAKKLVSSLYDNGTRYLDFTGGEPLLYRDLCALAIHAKGLGIKTEVTTNGIPLGEDYFERLSELADVVDKLNISLDTLDPCAYLKARGVDKVKDVCETAERLSQISPIRIMCVVTEDNINRLDDIINFAQKIKAQIYLNTEFSFFGDKEQKEHKFTDEIISRLYDDYTVVFLHFTEFISAREAIPPCSANRQTVTISPAGGIILPCYHSQKELMDIDGDLESVLNSGKMAYFQEMSGKLDCCRNCAVVPYMGISFSFKFNRYFILQSFSEKLKHLKQNYTNGMSGRLEVNKSSLLRMVRQFIDLAASMDERNNSVNIVNDCWELKDAPHYFFDLIYYNVYPKLKAMFASGDIEETDYYRIFSDSFEFQLRLWSYYLSRFLSTKTKCDVNGHEQWLKAHLNDILRCFDCGDDDVKATEAIRTVMSLFA